MMPMTCRTTRRDLAAYRDGELSMDRQLALRAHLAACGECLAEAEAVDRLGGLIRHASTTRVDAMRDTLASVHARVMARVHADPPAPLGRRAARALDDQGHWLWAAAGATFATVVCLLALLGVMRLSLREQPESMAAIIGAMAVPVVPQEPLAIDDRLLPRAFPVEVMPAALAERDAAFALAAFVNQDGDVQLTLLGPGAMRAWEAEQVLEVLDLAAHRRNPVRASRPPTDFNVVWLLAHTTVIGKERELQMTPGLRRLRDIRVLPATPRTSVPMSSTQEHGRTLV